ncbi:MAG TPA: hypothetical protein VGL11_11010 [Candidatus Binatia bacterium]|jgi:hypothetical protein
MSRCLKDRTLLLLHDGEGTGAERTHLAECQACAARYELLQSDLKAIGQVLREEPPPRTAGRPLQPFILRWLPTAVAVALALVLVWERLPKSTPPAPPALSEEILSVMEAFPADLAQNPIAAEELWTVIAEAYERGVALEADWPCDWYDTPTGGEAEAVDGGFGDTGPAIPVCAEPGQS